MKAPHPIRFCFALATLLAAARAQEPRLANLSTRAQAGSGANVLTAGFVVGPGADKKILLRAIGPTLGVAPFNLPGVLADPQLILVNAAGVTVATNDDWQAADAATFSSVGAFALPTNSKDAAIVTTLAPGSYTAQVTPSTSSGQAGAGSTTGLALVEVYEVGATSSRLVNLSTRAFVGTGENVMIPGLVISPGSGTRRLLVRAAGPALASFGLTGALADPTITVTNASTGATVATNDDWGVPSGSGAANETALTAAFTRAGAFSFTRGSKDAALLVDLAPGNYGIQVSGVATTTGTSATGLVLVEVYDVTPPLAIFSVTPAEGPIVGGTTITLSGRGFAGATVLIDDQTVTPLAQTDTEIRLRMPAHENGYVLLTVRSATNTTATEFLYTPPRLQDLPAAYITTFAGIGNHYGFERPATLSPVQPWGVTMAPNGDIYFAQVTTPTSFILRVDGDGVLHRVAGTLRPDPFGTLGDGGAALNAVFGYPRSVALDAAGNIYIADGAPRLRKIDAATGIITTFAGTGVRGFSGDGGPATAAQVTEATHVKVAPDDSIYFLDNNTRVRRITPNGIISTVAGNGVVAVNVVPDNGDGGLAINAQINSFMNDGGDLAVDRDGNLFILEMEGARVRKVDAKTGVITTFASRDARGKTLVKPRGLALDLAGNVYVAAASGITKFDPTGRLIDSWGDGVSDFSEDGTPVRQMHVGSPLGMVVAPNGDIIWSEEAPSRLRKINVATGRLETVAGNGPSVPGVPGRAIGATFSSPGGDLAFLPSGDLLFTDSGFILRITPAGQITTFGGTGIFRGNSDEKPVLEANFDSGVALETTARGEVFWANKQTIRRIDTNGIVHRYAGNAYGFSGDGGPALSAFLCQPEDFAFDRAGHLFIADTNNNRIRRVDAATGIITTVVGTGPSNGYENYGAGAYGGDGGPAVQAQLNGPMSVVVRDDGTMFVSDWFNRRVRKVTPDGVITTAANWPERPTKMILGPAQSIFAHGGNKIYRVDGDQVQRIVGNGINGFGGDGGPALNAKLLPGGSEQAQGLAIDNEGNLFIHDAGNRRIRAVRFGAVLAPTGATIELRASDSTIRALVRDAAGRPAPGVRVDFAAPATGPSCVLSSSFAITDATGVATISCASNHLSGTYAVTARPLTASNAATVAFTNIGDKLIVAQDRLVDSVQLRTVR